jgi:hypothetical protein
MAKNRLRYGDDFVLKNNQVGIGTSTPTAKLDVTGDVKISGNLGVAKTITNPSFTGIITFVGLTASNTSAGFARTNQVEFKSYARDNGTLSFNGYGNQILTLNDNFDADAFVVSNYIPKAYSFVSSGLFTPTDFIEQAFRIDRVGNTIVGIGTSIGAKLDVRGSVSLGIAHTATTAINAQAIPPHRINGDTTIFGQIRPRQPFSDLSNFPTSNYIAMSPTFGDNTGALNFYTGTASTTQIPNQILSLSNNISGSLFRVNDPNVGFTSATNLTVGVAFTAILEVNSNGNIGIGTSIPTSKLHVVGNTLITGITTVGLGTISSPAINSSMSFELTSNNTLTVRVRGADGTIRTGTIVLT